MSNTLELKLLGKDYKVACGADERETLLAAVRLVESKFTEIGSRTRCNGERLAVMAALDLANELLVQKSIPADTAAGLASESIQRRIDSIESRIASALEHHQALF